MLPQKMTSKVVYEPSIKSYARCLIFSIRKNLGGGGIEIQRIKFQPRKDQKKCNLQKRPQKSSRSPSMKSYDRFLIISLRKNY